jgi:hypothetical protein
MLPVVYLTFPEACEYARIKRHGHRRRHPCPQVTRIVQALFIGLELAKIIAHD